MRTRQIRPTQVRARRSAPKIGPGKVESSCIEPFADRPQTSPVSRRALPVPRYGAAGEHRDMLIVWHLLSLLNRTLADFELSV